MAKQTIILTLHEEYEMAEIRCGRQQVFLGNYWDFHNGCHGTTLFLGAKGELDFEKEWGDHIRGPFAVARMISEKTGMPVEIKKRLTPFRC